MTEEELVRSIAMWERMIARLQRSHRARWHVPGLSDEEVKDAIVLRLIEARDEQRDPLAVASEHLTLLRQRFRLGAVPVDFREVSVRERSPNQEDRCIEEEEEVCRSRARDSAEASLSRPQRRWLAAMKMAANSGDFFRASNELNLSAASRILGKNRSSAQRAYTELAIRFRAERDRLR